MYKTTIIYKLEIATIFQVLLILLTLLIIKYCTDTEDAEAQNYLLRSNSETKFCNICRYIQLLNSLKKLLNKYLVT